MNKLSFSFLVVLGYFFSLQACAEGAYAGIDVGVNKTNIGGYKSSAPSIGLVGGWYFIDNLALEAVVSGSRDSFTESEFDSGSLDSFSAKQTIEGRRIGLRVVLQYDLPSGFYTDLKPGLSYTSTVSKYKGNENGVDFSARGRGNSTHPTLAVGVGYKFNNKVSSVVGYERQFKAVKNDDDRFSSNAFSAGLRYHF